MTRQTREESAVAKDQVTPEYEDADADVDYDIDAEYDAEAQRREATKGRIVMRVGGKVFHFRPMGQWDFQITQQINDDNDMEAMAYEALEEDEAAALLEIFESGKFPVGKFRKLMERLEQASGLGRGKQRGSSKRSRPRRKR
jgi:hypothetical protein